MSYFAPDSYYELDDEPQGHTKKEFSELYDKIDNSQIFLEAIVKQLYSTQELDIVEFERDLENLCYYLDVRFNAEPIQIVRKPGKIEQIANFFRKEAENFMTVRRG